MCLNRKFLLTILIISGLIGTGIFKVHAISKPNNVPSNELKYVANVFLDDATNEWFVYDEEPSLDQIKKSLVSETDKNVNGHIIKNVSTEDNILYVNGDHVDYRICKVPLSVIKEW